MRERDLPRDAVVQQRHVVVEVVDPVQVVEAGAKPELDSLGRHGAEDGGAAQPKLGLKKLTGGYLSVERNCLIRNEITNGHKARMHSFLCRMGMWFTTGIET